MTTIRRLQRQLVVSHKAILCIINTMCDSRKYPYPSHGWFFRLDPPHPLGISVPEGSCITPHPPGISYFPFDGLYLLHLEIIDRVPLKINCSYLKTQFFIIFDLSVIFYKAICISYAGRACLIMSSLSLLLVHPAKCARQVARHENRD